jgi:hypothetical protein
MMFRFPSPSAYGQFFSNKKLLLPAKEIHTTISTTMSARSLFFVVICRVDVCSRTTGADVMTVNIVSPSEMSAMDAASASSPYITQGYALRYLHFKVFGSHLV